MATLFLSNAKLFFPSLPSTSSSASQTHHNQIVCKAGNETSTIVISRRTISLNLAAAAAAAAVAVLFTGFDRANAAILEADDDEELLEKVKKDRKKRLERQGFISSSAKETAFLQDVVYKLSKIGQALAKDDLSSATSVLGSSKDTEWLKDVNSALNKLSSSDEEKTEVDIFNISLGSLITSVSKNDVEASKAAFVASASAFEKWSTLTGLAGQLKGL